MAQVPQLLLSVSRLVQIPLHALEPVGTQEYELKPTTLTERFAAAYGHPAAAEVAQHLT